MMAWRLAACLVLGVTLSACGASPAAPTAPSISGRWEGTFESEGPGTIALQITQTGLNVTGSAVLSQNEFANVSGTLTGTLAAPSSPTTMQFTVTYEYGPFQCQGSFSGTLNVTSRTFDGAFSGQNCVRPFEGTLHATKTN